MNKEQFGEFHKYLAMLKYEYLQTLTHTTLTEEYRKECINIVKAIDEIMKVCVINEGDK